MGDSKEKKKEKEKSTAKNRKELDFLQQLNIAEDLEEAENELEDTYREF